jgi:Mrp family chromosome partitioning ATPase
MPAEGWHPLLSISCLPVSMFARTLASRTSDKRSNMKTIAIISQKGGAGKTTISIHLAVAAEQKGMKTALFDLDLQASASSWSDKRNKPSPAVVSAQAARLSVSVKLESVVLPRGLS